MSEVKNALLLGADALLYFSVLATLFRFRHRLGIGTFFCMLGVMHFIETYLASVFYVSLPFGAVASPGSAVLFTGKLMILLLVYIREDATVARQPIYGLLIGNLLMVALAMVMRQHDLVTLGPDRLVNLTFVNEMGGLMVWGTVLLFLDSIFLILIYERSREWLGQRTLARILMSSAMVLTFDQIGFFAALRVLLGVEFKVMIGGWAAKMVAVAIYGALIWIYLRYFEKQAADGTSFRRIADVFSSLTYRERYEELLARSGRDALTGVLDRGELETQGRNRVLNALRGGRPISILIVDVDHFKQFNDRYGHAMGDAVLRRIADTLSVSSRDSDLVFRFGGEEFVVISDGATSDTALKLGERIRRAVAGNASNAPGVTVSIGLATCAEEASEYDEMFAIADRRLYEAKALGRNCVIGKVDPAEEKSVRLAYAG